MATDKQVKIDIHTQATGDGSKKTIEDLNKLKEATGSAGMSGQKFVGGTREWRDTIDAAGEATAETKEVLHEMVDEFVTLKTEVNKASKSNDKHAKSEKKVGDEAKKEARNLDKVNTELAEAKRRLAAATIGSKGFERAQARVNTLSKEYSRTMPRATKSTRNFGLAALEGSRAMEDLQYGVAGVLNNIPGMVMMLGGSAGLTAVISLVAVGLHQLTKDMGKASKKMGDSADEFERVQEAQRQGIKSSKSVIEDYGKSIENLKDNWGAEGEAIKTTTGLLKTQLGARTEIAQSYIDLERLKNNLDTKQPKEEHAKRETELQGQESTLHKEAKDESAQIDIAQLARKKELLKKEKEALEIKKEQNIEERKLLELFTRKAKRGEEIAERLKNNLDKVQKDASSAFEFSGESRSTYEDGEKGDDQFLLGLKEEVVALKKRVDQGSAAAVPLLKVSEKKVADVKRAQDVYENTLNKLRSSTSVAKILKQKLADDKAYTEEATKNTTKRTEDLKAETAAMDIQINRVEKLAEVDAKKTKLLNNVDGEIGKLEQTKTNISAYTANRAAGNLGALGDENKEVQGDSKDEIAQHKANIAEGAKEVAAIVEGGVDGSEFKPLITALQKMKGSMAKDNAAGLTAVNSLLAMSKMQFEKMKETNKQIKALKAQLTAL